MSSNTITSNVITTVTGNVTAAAQPALGTTYYNTASNQLMTYVGQQSQQLTTAVGNIPTTTTVGYAGAAISGGNTLTIGTSAPNNVQLNNIGGLTWLQSGTHYVVLSKEEQDELNELARQRSEETKIRRKEEFKKLAPEFRQFVINNIIWQRKAAEMATVEAEKSDREKELENKQNGGFVPMSGFSGGGFSTHQHSTGWYNTLTNGVVNTSGLTDEELMEAHNEATLEEALSDEQEAV